MLLHWVCWLNLRVYLIENLLVKKFLTNYYSFLMFNIKPPHQMFSVQPLFNLFLNNYLPVIPQNLLCLRFNAKSFVIASLVFFSFWSSFLDGLKQFLANVLRLIIKKKCDQDLTYSRGTPKNISVKNFPQVVIRDACGTWYSLCTVTNIHSMLKTKETVRNSETC